MTASITTFNSPLEAGVRAISVLVPAYPRAFDIQRLVAFDYLVVHTGDIGGPHSLHPQLPQRSAELLVRRSIVERGLHLLMHRGLVERHAEEKGIYYRAGDLAETFIMALETRYVVELRARGNWVVETFGDMAEDTLKKRMAEFFGRWMEEFHAVQQSLAFES